MWAAEAPLRLPGEVVPVNEDGGCSSGWSSSSPCASGARRFQDPEIPWLLGAGRSDGRHSPPQAFGRNHSHARNRVMPVTWRGRLLN